MLLQEMTGRKPEGGEERELIYSWSTHTRGEETAFARTSWCLIER